MLWKRGETSWLTAEIHSRSVDRGCRWDLGITSPVQDRYCTDSGSKWCHQGKMAASISGIFWLPFCTSLCDNHDSGPSKPGWGFTHFCSTRIWWRWWAKTQPIYSKLPLTTRLLNSVCRYLWCTIQFINRSFDCQVSAIEHWGEMSDGNTTLSAW